VNIADRTLNALQGKTFACQQADAADLVYTVNWASTLNSDIATSVWSSTSSGVTIAATSNTTATASARITGDPGKHHVTNTITTAAGETDERVISLTITGNAVQGDYE
jgi:hypothetical protein